MRSHQRADPACTEHISPTPKGGPVNRSRPDARTPYARLRPPSLLAALGVIAAAVILAACGGSSPSSTSSTSHSSAATRLGPAVEQAGRRVGGARDEPCPGGRRDAEQHAHRFSIGASIATSQGPPCLCLQPSGLRHGQSTTNHGKLTRSIA